MKEQSYYQCAILMARMYGIAETLEAIPYLPETEFLSMMKEWSEEYIKSDLMDIVYFFERKLEKIPRKKQDNTV